jgi:hypothetical protein
MPGLDIIDRFTSREAAVNLNGEVFMPQRINHKTTNDSIDPEQSTCSITSRAFVGNPLGLIMPTQIDVPLYLQVLECPPDINGTATSAKLRFSGRVKSVKTAGPIYTADIVHVLQAMDRNVPRWIKQPTCNYTVYGVPCGLSSGAFTSTGTIVSQTGSQLVLSGVATSRAVGYFVSGRLIFGTAATYQTRKILNSTAVSGGSVTLTLDRPL